MHLTDLLEATSIAFKVDILSVLAFMGNQTHDLDAASAVPF